MKIGILDYGAGNIQSVETAFLNLSQKLVRINSQTQFSSIDALVFPGVGSAHFAMQQLTSLNLVEPLRNFQKPMLGICVGMQLLGRVSEEVTSNIMTDDGLVLKNSRVELLNLLPFEVRKLNTTLPIPHMGWNNLTWNTQNIASRYFAESNSLALLDKIETNVYFVHSFSHFEENLIKQYEPWQLATTTYGSLNITAFVAQKNIWGMQFHVEKSGKTGLKFLQSFLNFAEDFSKSAL